MITMKDIVREGHPALRKRGAKVEFPLSDEHKALAKEMLEYLHNSQDDEIAAKYGLRAGVGLAAPQLGKSIQMTALFVPSYYEDEEPYLDEVWINPRIIRESVKRACLREGEGCLSVDRDVPGMVVRAARITVQYYTVDGEKITRKLDGYEAIVVQHEIDHLNGVMFYDHIDKENPLNIPTGVNVLG
ncbi:peptide deformylase [Granulicatella balaenopterae]|uniref:Peptide deformylase n=1 Tax=Granulicatella balaenopterae TaxID=137733 RepID=A0A1H9PL95_9LACT|nr:peptide deformylase [Granulicatella balaenopterae]SER48579.1 peptide deformylase [Granulicatella balaenopterae]